MIGVVLVLTAVGGLVAREIYEPTPSPTAAVVSAAPPPVTTSGAPVKQPGSSTVQLSADAAAMPYGSAVQQLLQVYFDSINAKNYVEWESVVTQAFIDANPQPYWLNSYQTSADGSIYVYRIDAAPQGGLRVMLTFTSVQDKVNEPSFAPYTCINWHSVLPLVRQDSGWKVDSGSNGQHPPTTECQN